MVEVVPVGVFLVREVSVDCAMLKVSGDASMVDVVLVGVVLVWNESVD